MAEKKVIELEVSSNLGNLKQQLRDAQLEVQTLSEKFGATSASAVDAAKKAAVLKDKISDAKALTDAFNPDAKFKALSGSLTGVAGGFSVVTGAMGAFGKQNEDVEKALLKVQSAMALASGAQAIGESIDSFKQLGAVLKANTIIQKLLTAAQWLYNAAMAANPLGVIIVAITALIAAGYALIKMFSSSTDANAKNESAIKKNDAALKQQIKTSERSSEALKTKNGHEYEMAKASGASAESLRKLAIKHAEAQIALEKSTLATAKDTYEKNKNTLANLINSDASEEQIAKQRELTTEALKAVTEERKELEAAIKDKADIIRKNAVEVRQELTENNNKVKDANKAHNEAIKQQNEEAAKAKKDRIKTLNENILSLNEELRVSKLTDEQKEVDALNKKYDKVIKDGKKAKIDVALLEEEKRLALAGITKKYDDLEQVAIDENTAKDKEKIATEKAVLEELTLSEAELKLQKLTTQYKADQLLYKDNKEILKALDVKYGEDTVKIEEDVAAKKKAVLEELTLSEGELKLKKLTSQYEADQLLYKDNKEILKALDVKYKEDTVKIEEDVAAKKKAADQKVLDDKKKTLDEQLDLTKKSFQAFADVATLFAGKNKKAQKTAFNIQKAANIAATTIDTYTAAMAAYKSASAVAIIGPALAPIAAAGAVAVGLMNIKKIAASKFEGGGTPTAETGGGGGGGGATAPTMSAPQFNVVGQSGVNQLASLGQQPVQAYVVSGQVTSQQSLDRNRLANATLGG